MWGLWLTRVLGAIGFPLFVLGLMASVAMTVFILMNPDSLKARLNLGPLFLGISVGGMALGALLLKVAAKRTRP